MNIMHTSTRQTSNQLSAYAIFLILERQRNLKLRELYRNNPVVDTLLPVISEEDSSSPSSSTTATTSRKSSLRQAIKQKKKHDTSSSTNTTMSTLPRFPPRYQALSNIITSDVLMMQLRTTSTSQRSSSRHRSSSSSQQHSSCFYSPSSFYMEEYKHLDQVTRQFLNDTVKILQERCREEIENNEAMLEIHMKRSIMNRRRMKVGEKKLFAFRAERKLSLIVD